MANTSISIDGFVAGPNHEMDWIFNHDFLPKVPIQPGAVGPGGRSGAAYTRTWPRPPTVAQTQYLIRTIPS